MPPRSRRLASRRGRPTPGRPGGSCRRARRLPDRAEVGRRSVWTSVPWTSMGLPDLGDSVVRPAVVATWLYASAEKPNFSTRSVSRRYVSVSYHAREQVRPQGRLHVHLLQANATGVTLGLFRCGRSPL